LIRPVDSSVLRLGHSQQSRLPPVGQTVAVRVLRVLPGNRVLLRLGGANLVAKATIRLSPNQSLTATVGKSGTTTVLRIDPPNIEQTFFRQAGVPQDAASRALFRAMVRAGMALDPEVLRRLRASLDPNTRPTDRTARLLVEAHRKGIALPSRAVEAFGDLSGEAGTGSEGRPSFHGQPQDRGSGTPDKKRGDQEGPEASASPERQAVAGALRQLFNHVGTGEDHWVVLPLVFDGRTDWKGSARIRFDAQGRWQEAAVRFDSGAQPDWAIVSATGRSVNLFSRRDPGQQAEHKLREGLRKLGFLNLSLEPLPDDFDGFSTRYSPDIIRPIDEEA
jgi:hypothetical protein